MKNRIIAIIVITIILSIAAILNMTLSGEPEEEIIEKTTTAETTTTTNSTEIIQKQTTLLKKKKIKKKSTKVKTASKEEYYEYARQQGGYDEEQMTCLINLWNRESGWNPNSRNKSSGACGIPQAYPCSKIKKQQGSNDWQAQIRWGINYVNYKYKSPCKAWKHFKNKGWY